MTTIIIKELTFTKEQYNKIFTEDKKDLELLYYIVKDALEPLE